jgi:hypothetical protein
MLTNLPPRLFVIINNKSNFVYNNGVWWWPDDDLCTPKHVIVHKEKIYMDVFHGLMTDCSENKQCCQQNFIGRLGCLST